MTLRGRLEGRLARAHAVLADDSDVQTEPPGDRGDIWPRVTKLAAVHPRLADTTVALLAGVISVAWSIHRDLPLPGAATWALQAALIVPLVWRRCYPVTVFALISVVALVQWALGVELVADLAVLVALYTVASHRPRVVAALAATIVEAGAVMASLRWSLAGSWLRSLVFLSGLVAAAVLLGTNLRSRRSRLAALTERAERLERERDQRALLAAADERARIAREMHDVIAHSLAVMISLADGAAAKLRSDPQRAAAAIANVSTIGRQALGDTRRLLGVLRPDQVADGLSPQPGVGQIDALLEQVRNTGLAATMKVTGQRRPLPPGVELTAYRIVQEATTNVLKHAVGASSVVVVLEYEDEVLGICIRDDGRAAAGGPGGRPGPDGGGHGLAGMRERAQVYNGDVSTGPCGDGWEVRARLPVDPPAGPPPVPDRGPVSPVPELQPSGPLR